MEKFIDIYHSLFPHTGLADWFYAFVGLMVHVAVKLKNVPLKKFRWRVLLQEYVIVWYISLLTIMICLGSLPQVMSNYSILDSALIGYSSSSFFKQLFKTNLSKLSDNDH